MALIVEDGTGLPTSESYLSPSDAEGLARKWGQSFSQSSHDAESALRIGTVWLDSQYTFPGDPLNDDQALAWPRGERGIPERIKAALAVAAAFAQSSEEDLTPTLDGPAVTQEVVGPVSVTYAKATLDRGPVLTLVDAILNGLGRRKDAQGRMAAIIGTAARG